MTDLDKVRIIDPEIARQMLELNPLTGRMWWRERPPEMFRTKRAYSSWNARYSGSEAFTFVTPRGYRQGSLCNVTYQSHRVVYAHFHGVDPLGEIDHIDGDGLNNSISNLRLVTHSQNMKNIKRRAGKVSPKGAYWHDTMRKWESKIMSDGAIYRLGFYETAEDAHKAYCAASAEIHGSYGRTQ